VRASHCSCSALFSGVEVGGRFRNCQTPRIWAVKTRGRGFLCLGGQPCSRLVPCWVRAQCLGGDRYGARWWPCWVSPGWPWDSGTQAAEASTRSQGSTWLWHSLGALAVPTILQVSLPPGCKCASILSPSQGLTSGFQCLAPKELSKYLLLPHPMRAGAQPPCTCRIVTFFLFWQSVLQFKLKASCLLGRRSIT
jgi:hypothetical protein